jgi:hypothetical protein
LPGTGGDADRDGLPDAHHDADRDGLLDGDRDGFPGTGRDVDHDADRDGRLDADRDADRDGVPDTGRDADRDGLLDGDRDGLPGTGRDADRDADRDGLPDAHHDADRDGLLDGDRDGFPGTGRDVDNDADRDGLPDAHHDADRDGLPDADRDDRREGADAVAAPSVTGPASEVERAAESAERKAGALLAAGEVERYRARGLEVQTGFVDSPRDTVQRADQLTGELLDHLTRTFTEERHRLEQQWDGGDDIATDDLRAAFQRYRSFFDRLLST